MECGPTANPAVPKVAWPLINVTVPISRLPSLNVTVPSGVAPTLPVGLRVKVRLTVCPNTDGLVVEVNDVVPLPLLIVCVTTGELLPAKLESPLYTAVIG